MSKLINKNLFRKEGKTSELIEPNPYQFRTYFINLNLHND